MVRKKNKIIALVNRAQVKIHKCTIRYMFVHKWKKKCTQNMLQNIVYNMKTCFWTSIELKEQVTL